jgi:hypothetical protein
MPDIVFAFDPALDRPIPRLDAAPPAVAELVAAAPLEALETAAAIARQSEAQALVLFGRVLDPQRASPAQAAHLRLLVTGLLAHRCRTVAVVPDEGAKADLDRLLGSPAGLDFVTPTGPLLLDVRGIPVEILSADGPHDAATAALLPAGPTGVASHPRRIVVGWDAAHWTGERWDDETARAGTAAARATGWSAHAVCVWGSRRRGGSAPGIHHLPALQARAPHEAAAGGCGVLTLLDHPPVADGLPAAARPDHLASRGDWRNSWREAATHHVAWQTITVPSATGGDEELATAIWSAIEGLAIDPQGPLRIIRCHVECGTSVSRRVRIAEISAETLARLRQLYDSRSFRAWCCEVLAAPAESLAALGHSRSGAKPGSTTSFATTLADIVTGAERGDGPSPTDGLAREAGWAALELLESI